MKQLHVFSRSCTEHLNDPDILPTTPPSWSPVAEIAFFSYHVDPLISHDPIRPVGPTADWCPRRRGTRGSFPLTALLPRPPSMRADCSPRTRNRVLEVRLHPLADPWELDRRPGAESVDSSFDPITLVCASRRRPASMCRPVNRRPRRRQFWSDTKRSWRTSMCGRVGDRRACRRVGPRRPAKPDHRRRRCAGDGRAAPTIRGPRCEETWRTGSLGSHR